jgi:hypothetical protein
LKGLYNATAPAVWMHYQLHNADNSYTAIPLSIDKIDINITHSVGQLAHFHTQSIATKTTVRN